MAIIGTSQSAQQAAATGEFIENHPKNIYENSTMLKPVWTYLNLSVDICTYLNLSELVWTYLDLSELIQTYPNISEPIQTYPENIGTYLKSFDNLLFW